jgi:signal transduction histidine kinase
LDPAPPIRSAEPALSEEPVPLGGDRLDETVSEALRMVRMREHTLLSLSELSQELTISLDTFSFADLVLFNLMGQLGTPRSAMWLVSETGSGAPVLVRSHGINRQVARALGTACTAKLMECFAADPAPFFAAGIDQIAGAAAARLVERADIALFAPITARKETLGLLAVGSRIGGQAFGAVDIQAMQASLSMVAVAIQNMRFYNHLLEKNRQLRLANEELEHLDRLKSQFLSNVNHELRTPLTNVIAYVDCLLDRRNEQEHVQDFLKVVMEEALKLQGLLENLLAFSAVTQDKLKLDLVTGDVAVPLERYCGERLPGVSKGLRELVFTPELDLPHARFDEKRLLQIVDALIDNAVKFTPEGSRVELRVSHAFEGDKTWVRIDVIDDGPGISKERLPALFDSFRQADGSSTRTVGGMGMGLAFARELAAAMGGRLVANSEIGKGSTFTLLLPTI